MRLAHIMIRVNNLEESLRFYQNTFNLKVLRTLENKEYKYTLVFLGFEDIDNECVLELTYNWDKNHYDHGSAFGHLCFQVKDMQEICDLSLKNGGITTKQPSLLKGGKDMIAFIKDPNGYSIELIPYH
jgi:lactoylglutathione lyase